MTGRGSIAALLVLSSAAVRAALGQSLGDPTRPPDFTNEAALGDEASRQLQSVLLSRGRKLAVINGEVVALGGHLGEGVVTAITETQVVVSFPDHTETLKLLGGIERKPVRGATAKGGK